MNYLKVFTVIAIFAIIGIAVSIADLAKAIIKDIKNWGE